MYMCFVNSLSLCHFLVILITIHYIFRLGCSCRSQYALRYITKNVTQALISHQTDGTAEVLSTTLPSDG